MPDPRAVAFENCPTVSRLRIQRLGQNGQAAALPHASIALFECLRYSSQLHAEEIWLDLSNP